MSANAVHMDSTYFELYQTYMASNKELIKKNLELDLMGALLLNPCLYDFIFSKIKVEQMTDENKKAFQLIKDTNVNDELELLQLKLKLNKISFNDTSYKIDFAANEFYIKRKIQLFLQIHFSIELEAFFINQLKDIENSVDGLASLYDLRSKIDTLIDQIPGFESEKSLYDEIPQFLSSLEDIAAKNDLLKSVKFPSLNEITKGIAKDNLVTILGNSGHGKTFFATELIVDLALSRNIPVGIISLEMSRFEVMTRIIGSKLGINSAELRDPVNLRVMTPDKINEFLKACYSFENSKIYIHDLPMNELELRQKIKEWRDRYGVKCIMVDYIGLLESTQKYKTREETVSYLSAYIKNLCKEFHVPVILLGQTNRAGAKDPGSQNVAESYKIIANSDFVFTIFQPVKIDPSMPVIQLNEREIPVTSNLFIIKTDKTRFTDNCNKFAVKLEKGSMREVDLRL
jgi:replicative DNA helicase